MFTDVQTSIHCLFIIINMTISLLSNINEIFLKPMKDTIFNYCKQHVLQSNNNMLQ